MDGRCPARLGLSVADPALCGQRDVGREVARTEHRAGAACVLKSSGAVLDEVIALEGVDARRDESEKAGIIRMHQIAVRSRQRPLAVEEIEVDLLPEVCAMATPRLHRAEVCGMSSTAE